jgi:hypothetical protein
VRELRAPASASEFERTARQLAGDDLARYVRLVPPSKYAAFFQVSLEASHLTAIATALHRPRYGKPSIFFTS